MIINPYTKETYNSESVDLSTKIMNEKVKKLYNKYKGVCECFLSSLLYANSDDSRYYVYVWYAKTEPKRFFYVGKGTGNRWKHILSDINKTNNGKHNIRFQMYNQIMNRWGIDCTILLENLSEYDALVYEQCIKLDYLQKGEVLLNIEGIPEKYALHDWDGETADIPILQKSRFYDRYLDDFNKPFFDSIDIKYLRKTYFYPFFLDTEASSVIDDKNTILLWLEQINAKVYRSVSTKTESVIVQGILRYDRYIEYRKQGLKIFSSKDIISYIKSPK